MSFTSFIHTLANNALGIVTQDIEPALVNFLKTFSHDAVQAALPIATAELATVESDAIAALGTGNWAGFTAAVGVATAATIVKTVGMVEGVGVNDAITAVNTLVAGHAGIQAAAAQAIAKPTV